MVGSEGELELDGGAGGTGKVGGITKSTKASSVTGRSRGRNRKSRSIIMLAHDSSDEELDVDDE